MKYLIFNRVKFEIKPIDQLLMTMKTTIVMLFWSSMVVKR